jgi:hypothetical protein
MAIVLLMGHFCSTPLLREFCKLPNLLCHFVQHKSQNQNLGFLDFVKAHYASNDLPEDAHDHLPFKCKHQHASSFFQLTLPQNQEFKLDKTQDFLVQKRIKFAYWPLCAQKPNFSIWQPPQLFSSLV